MEFTEGCMWEGSSWQIIIDAVCSSYRGGNPCSHCHTVTSVIGNETKEVTWICPMVVVAKNEGGWNSTGVCLQCIVKGAHTVGLLVDQAQAQAHSVTSSS